jgi:ribosomal protein S1
VGKVREKPIAQLKAGAVVSGVVSNASAQFGLFIDIGAEKDALWRSDQLDKPVSEYTVGDKIEGLKIVSVNAEKKLVEVSTRRLTSDVKVGEIFEGTVNQVTKFGVFFDAGFSSDVLAPPKGVSKQVDSYTKGEVADLRVIKVEGSRVTVTTVLEEKIVRGQTVSGTVKTVDPNIGLFIDVGETQEALLRTKSLGDKSLSDYSVGDEVQGLTVTQLDRANGIFEVSTFEGLAAAASSPVKSLGSLPVGTSDWKNQQSVAVRHLS